MPETFTDGLKAVRAAVRGLLIALLIGMVAGVITWVFLASAHVCTRGLWEVLPDRVPWAPRWLSRLVVIAGMSVLAALAVRACKGRPFDVGAAEAEFHAEGRISPRHLFGGIVFSLASLLSGAAIGPEAPLTSITGGLGTRIATRFKLRPDLVRVMSYAGVAGAFGSLFGVAPAGALLAAELINPKSAALDRTTLAAGLSSGASAWVAFALLGGRKLAPLLVFPGTSRITFLDLGSALLLGLAGGLIGLLYLMLFSQMRSGLGWARERPWLGALLGGAAVALASAASPYLLFSGQEHVGHLVADVAEFSALALFALGAAKLVFCAWGLSTGYFGGPLFPVLFSGVCFGLALHRMAPGIPEGVAVSGVIAGMVTAAAAAPFSITIFLGLLSDSALIPVIAIAAVGAFILRQAFLPVSRGIYWNSQSSEGSGGE